MIEFRQWRLPAVLTLSFAGLGLASDRDLAEQAYQEGSRLVRNGQHDEAIEVLTRAIELAPDDPDAYRWRAEAYAAIGEIDKSFDDRDRCAELEVLGELTAAGKQRLLFWLAGAACFALVGIYLASIRGRPVLLGVLIGGALGPVGVIVLLLLPERSNRPILSDSGPYQEEDVTSTRSCPSCSREVSVHTRVCPRCQTRLVTENGIG